MYKLKLEGLSLDEKERILYPIVNETWDDMELMDRMHKLVDNIDFEAYHELDKYFED